LARSSRCCVLLHERDPAIIVAAIISLIAHFAVGASKSLITNPLLVSSGLEMTGIGALEGVVTYIIGVA